MSWIGRALPRREDERILRGGGRFLDDIEPAGIAARRVRAQPVRAGADRRRHACPTGVTAFTAAEHLRARCRVQAPPGVEHLDAPHPLLADDEVRYAGQAVVLVLADSRALAEDAAELVEVDYDPLDAVVDPRAAPELLRFEQTAGDVDGAFAAAAHVVRAAPRDPARGGGADGDARRRRRARRRRADGLGLRAGHAPHARGPHRGARRARSACDCPTSAARSAPRACPRRRSRRPPPRRCASAGRSSGPRTASRTSSPPARAAACRPTSSWRSTATGACSPSVRGSSPTSAPTCSSTARRRRTRPRC